MTRPTQILHPDLLTRSDLASLQVAATDVFHWLADGALEQVGRLRTEAGDDPVFAVNDDTLRTDLAARLAAVGRDGVAMELEQVRARLERIAAAEGDAPIGPSTTTDDGDGELEETAREVEAALLDATDMVAEAELLLQHAAEAAAQEALASGAREAVDDEEAGEQCFDLDALTQQLDAFEVEGGAPVGTEPPPEQRPVDEERAVDGEPEQNDMAEVTEEQRKSDALAPQSPPIDDPSHVADSAAAQDVELQHEQTTEMPEVDAEDADVGASAERAGDATSLEADEIDARMAEQAGTSVDAEPAAEPLAETETAEDTELDQATVQDEAQPVEDADPVEAPNDVRTESEPAPSGGADRSVADAEATPAVDDRVVDLLGGLRDAVVELARRPDPSPVDLAPLVAAVQHEFGRTTERTAETTVALQALTETVARVGTQVEAGLAKAIASLPAPAAAAAAPPAERPAAPPPSMPRFVTLRPNRQGLVLGAVAVLVVCWSILFWIKTGSPRLALATLVGANLVGCCILLGRRDT